MRKRTFVSILAICVALLFPLIVAHGAGGRIEGKVTDPKGAAIAGASVTITDDANNRKFTAVTDKDGRYKAEGLPAGVYTVVISATGFVQVRQDTVKVEEGATVPLDKRLEISSIEASVDVAATGSKGNSDPTYANLRTLGKTAQDFSAAYATVNNLILIKEGAAFNLKSGELYFLAPVEGRYTAAVFIGDGEFALAPPTEAERNSLQLFTNEPSITEQFTTLTIRFTDKTYDQVKTSPAAHMGTGGPQASRASDLFRENQLLLRKRLRDNSELRVLADLYAPERPGFFYAFINGKRYSKLVYAFNPLGIPEVSPEEVLLFSYGEDDGGFWSAFHRIRSTTQARRVVQRIIV